jgi:prephenate dehydrogenase
VRYERGDITVPSGAVAEHVAQADLVLLAVPERVALAAVAPLAARMRPGTLLADTLSVKGRIAALVRSEPRHVEAVSLNPMFAPSLGMKGRPIAVVTLIDGPRARALRELLAVWGARVVPIEAADHDRVTAAIQVATHGALLGFGFALQDLGVTTEELCGLAPPPHLTMLGMLARIVSGVPEVYWDIQASNPEAPFARKALQRGIERLAAVMENGCEADFAALFAKVKDFLSPYDADLADVCTKVFNTLPPAPGPGNAQVNRT